MKSSCFGSISSNSNNNSQPAVLPVFLCVLAVPLSVWAGSRAVGGWTRQTATGHLGWRTGQGCWQGAAGASAAQTSVLSWCSCILNSSRVCNAVAFRLLIKQPFGMLTSKESYFLFSLTFLISLLWDSAADWRQMIMKQPWGQLWQSFHWIHLIIHLKLMLSKLD